MEFSSCVPGRWIAKMYGETLKYLDHGGSLFCMEKVAGQYRPSYLGISICSRLSCIWRFSLESWQSTLSDDRWSPSMRRLICPQVADEICWWWMSRSCRCSDFAPDEVLYTTAIQICIDHVSLCYKVIKNKHNTKIKLGCYKAQASVEGW